MHAVFVLVAMQHLTPVVFVEVDQKAPFLGRCSRVPPCLGNDASRDACNVCGGNNEDLDACNVGIDEDYFLLAVRVT